MAETLDWSKLPPGLEWLAVPAERYGRFQFDDRIYDFLRAVGPAERAELQALGRRWADAWPAINVWLDAHQITAHPEARLVYFTGVLLGTGADAGLLCSDDTNPAAVADCGAWYSSWTLRSPLPRRC